MSKKKDKKEKKKDKNNDYYKWHKDEEINLLIPSDYRVEEKKIWSEENQL